ncbi:MAG: GIY-YIG nuclease family protein [Myxococcota bacterium]
MGHPTESVPPTSAQPSAWWVYVLVSTSAGRTYVGVTTDPERRLAEHNGERAGGARSTRAGRPWRLGRVHGPFDGRGEAQALEHRLRRRRGADRLGPATPAEP